MTDTPDNTLVISQNQPAGIQIKQEMTLKEAAQTMASSGFFKDAKGVAQAAVKLIIGQELGLSIVASMKGIHVFEGNIELATTTMATLIKRSEIYRVKIIKADDEGCELLFEEKGDYIPNSGKNPEWQPCGPAATFTVEEATKAGLMNKDNWKKYPGDMCYSRALSRGFRRYCPELAGGPVYVEGETSDPSEPMETTVEVIESEGNVSLASPDPSQALEVTPEAPNAAPEAQAEASEGENAPEAQEPAEHPYTRFCAKCQLLKERIEELDGETARYYQVFGTHGFENKGQVPKGQTKAMREIVLDLMSAIEEAQAEKEVQAAEALDGEVEDAETGEKIEPAKKAPKVEVVKEWPEGPEQLLEKEKEVAAEVESPDDEADAEDPMTPEHPEDPQDKNELPFD